MMSLELVSSQLTIAELEQQFGSKKTIPQPLEVKELSVHTVGTAELVAVTIPIAGCRGAVFFEPVTI